MKKILIAFALLLIFCETHLFAARLECARATKSFAGKCNWLSFEKNRLILHVSYLPDEWKTYIVRLN
jgi:hypothetical protein